MSELGPEARELMRAGRSAHQPTSDDRARIAEALRSRLDGLNGVLPNAPVLTRPRGFGWPILSAVVVGLGAGGIVVAGGLWSDETSVARAGAPSSVSAPPAVANPALDANPAAPVAPSPAVEPRLPGQEAATTRSRKQPSDRLAEEVEILSRAQTELHAGRFAGALRLLDEHARKFPRGTLAQERTAARMQALCGLGRMSEADTELARLSPGSLHGRSARDACAKRTASAAD